LSEKPLKARNPSTNPIKSDKKIRQISGFGLGSKVEK
jgi:hypothetical protein